MFDPQLLLGIVAILAFLGMLIGSWILHRRVRSWASLCLLLSIALLLISAFAADVINAYVVRSYDASHAKVFLNGLAAAINIIAPALLLLVASVGWLLLVRSVGSPIRTPAAVRLMFGTLFFILLMQASWLSGQHFARSYLPELQVPLLVASMIASITSLAFWVGIRRKASRHSPIAVVTFAVALFFILNISNKLLLPGFVGPLLLAAAAAFLFGSLGFVPPGKEETG